MDGQDMTLAERMQINTDALVDELAALRQELLEERKSLAAFRHAMSNLCLECSRLIGAVDEDRDNGQ